MTDTNNTPPADKDKVADPSKTADTPAADPAVAKQPVNPAPVRDPDEPLRPHNFSPEVELLYENLPRVLITPEAYKHMCLYVEIASKEVGWMGSVSRMPNGDFLIEETFLLEQEVHETETELAAEAIGRLAMSLIDSGDDGLEKSNKLRFWGHSHVHMGTFASGTDEATMDRFGREKMPWYVRGIFNKYGRGQFTIYLYDRGMRITDAAWAVYDPVKKSTVMQDRRRFGAFTSFVEGLATIAGVTVSPIATELQPSDELRQRVEAEFKAKVKERPMMLFRRKKPAVPADEAENSTDSKAASPADSTTEGKTQ